jgi:hypothetical protein
MRAAATARALAPDVDHAGAGRASARIVHLQPGPRPPALQTERQRHPLLVLAFTFFNSARVLAYLPTLWAIYVSGDSSQHSLWTWLTWLGANLTMGVWLHDRHRGGLKFPTLINLANAAMCLTGVLLICWCR